MRAVVKAKHDASILLNLLPPFTRRKSWPLQNAATKCSLRAMRFPFLWSADALIRAEVNASAFDWWWLRARATISPLGSTIIFDKAIISHYLYIGDDAGRLIFAMPLCFDFSSQAREYFHFAHTHYRRRFLYLGQPVDLWIRRDDSTIYISLYRCYCTAATTRQWHAMNTLPLSLLRASRRRAKRWPGLFLIGLPPIILMRIESLSRASIYEDAISFGLL